MSKLLPNLSALLATIPSTTVGDDLRALIHAATQVQAENELDPALSEVVDNWMRQ